jgi:hypothetical protein
MAKKTLKKISDFYDWDVEVVRIIMSALKFVSEFNKRKVTEGLRGDKSGPSLQNVNMN